MLTLTECTRQNTCFDCDNQECIFVGKKESDCPKYRCDRPDESFRDCEHCGFIDGFIEEMRRQYGSTKRANRTC